MGGGVAGRGTGGQGQTCGYLGVGYVTSRGAQARLVPVPLSGLAHRKPDIQRISACEVCTAHTTAPQQHTPPPVSQCPLVVKHLDCDDGIIGKLVIHGRLHVWKLGVEGVLGPGHMAGLVGSGYLHQRVGQVTGLEGHCYT